MYDAHPPGSIIKNRYRILEVLGQGGSGITYAATDRANDQLVALKELSLKGLSDWKKLELFEREAQVLEGLDHPAIPKYIDYFQVDTQRDRYFYIVQALARGRSLADLVAAGTRFSEAETRYIATEILQVLQYLHSLNPPIVHRDIKPQNIIYGDDDRIFLVDFGAVQSVYRNTIAFGSTVVGTFGYMAPEQFRGQAYPTTDLYGLGATLINLLTHQNPANLPQKRLKMDFRAAITTSDAFTNWLEGLIEPLAEERFESASTALMALTRPELATTKAISQHPAGSQIQLDYGRRHLSLKIPPAGLEKATARGHVTLAVVWNAIAWFVGLTVLPFFPLAVAVVFFVPFWAIGLAIAWRTLWASFEEIRLDISKERFTLKRRLFFWQQTQRGNVIDLERVVLETIFLRNDHPVKTLALREGIYSHQFGTALSIAEKEWLQERLDSFIQAQKE
ncbi:serine threonine protein kinase [Leptolyngbya sp. Heron Island J]|uniref:serine/threonine protein kinase n=1 Tax=Leptolyngbya sp. Heron Island J TaxID=1385935 RepID=UPI0003B97871|nr:serine/threonine-protein kinase [Leptolyngbya sp. Heron Island J]ESA39065.1 serine threonine protein kinase [Leptolyngbya sp. Heron Island J]